MTSSGRFYLRELENDGYIVDDQLKTVYVQAGKVTEVEWENTPNHRTDPDHEDLGRLQLHERLACRHPIPNTEFEIYNAGRAVWWIPIRTNKNGVAVEQASASGPL